MILLVKENQLLVFVHNCILWIKINSVALFVTKFSGTPNSSPENIMFRFCTKETLALKIEFLISITS